jgi:hypothetical protein
MIQTVNICNAIISEEFSDLFDMFYEKASYGLYCYQLLYYDSIAWKWQL